MKEVDAVLLDAQKKISEIVGMQVKVFYKMNYRKINIQIIWDAVLFVSKQESAVLASKIRKRKIVLARQVFCRYARHYTGLTLFEIANFIGNRDHTTIIHSLNSIQNLIDTQDEDAMEFIKGVEDYLLEFKYLKAS